MFDLYCDECSGPFAHWRPMRNLTLCERCDVLHPELCWECNQALATVIIEGYPTCSRCAIERGPVL